MYVHTPNSPSDASLTDLSPPAEAENWDDDFEFHSPTEDHPKTGEAPVRTSFSAANRESIVWDDDDEPLEQKLASTSRQAPQADSGNWGDSDDNGLRGVASGPQTGKTTLAPTRVLTMSIVQSIFAPPPDADSFGDVILRVPAVKLPTSRPHP
ncbi:hypothetical protein FRC00_014638 [Tulasnella sp. 408]|nr:hypothetical protein FRC00_014638 [Tulasnella sp. 408]